MHCSLYAQKASNDTLKALPDKNTQLDIADCFRYITKKTTFSKRDSVKTKSLGPFYTPILYPGYALVTGYLVGFANNISFYTHHEPDAKISSILIDDIYTQYKQYINIVRSNIWLNHEKFNLLGDWRYYKFPTNTFGIGSSTTLADKDPVDFSYLRINEIVMRNIVKSFSAGIGYSLDYHWDITESKTSPNLITDLDKYGLINKSTSSGITFNFQYDNRLNSNNTSNGTYANLQIRDNIKALGSNTNWQSATLDFRHYIRASKKSGNVLALWSYDCFTFFGQPPYFDLPSTGWDTYNNTAREYVEGRFRGKDLLYAEAEYRFRVTKNGLFGGVIFSNASSITELSSNRFEKVNYGTGLGLRVKMNKKSNSNLCIDYGVGTGNAKGFSFNINEVF
jgi:hypothetical protein